MYILVFIMGNKRKVSGAAHINEAQKQLAQVNRVPEKASGHDHKQSAGAKRSPEVRKSYGDILLQYRTALLLGGVMALALVIRLLPMAFSFVNGHVVFAEFDPYYHMRRIMYTVDHFPSVSSFDSYVNYPLGYIVGWPPLFDILGASLSLLAGLGHPSDFTIELTSAMLPVALGVLSIIPLYYIVKDIIGKNAALIASLVMAILPGSVFRTIFGFTDHHALEVFLLLLTYLLFTRAVTSAKSGGLSLSHVMSASGLKAQKKPLAYAALAGAGVASMIFAFDVSALFVSILVAYAFIQFAIDSLDRVSSQYLAIVGTIASLVALLIVAPPILISPAGQSFEISMVYLSWFHILYLAGMAGFFAIMGVLSNGLATRKAPWYLASVVFAAFAGIAAVVADLISPQIFVEIGRGLGFLSGSGGMAANISEMQPLLNFSSSTWYVIPWDYFSVAGLLAILGLVVYLLSLRRDDKLKNLDIFLIIWTATVVAVGVFQTRWVYLLAVTVSIFAGYVMYVALSLAGLDNVLSDNKVKKRSSKAGGAPITPALVGVSIIVLVMMVPVIDSSVTIADTPDQMILSWNEACSWVKDNTPVTSNLYSADQGTQPGYGIMTWWDYGNYVLYVAGRPAISNNFQTGIPSSSHFFIAQNETSADPIMDSVNARYVMVDNRMGSQYAGVSNGIFENMPELAGDDVDSYHMSYYSIQPSGIVSTMDGSEKYYDTMYSRLYNNEGMGGKNNLGNVTDGLGRYRYIYANGGVDPVKVFEYVSGARITGKADPSAIVELSLNITAPDGERTYVESTTADQHGSYIFTVPYPTSDSSMPVKTGSAYTIASGPASVRVQVPSDAITTGATITAGDL
jgi:dolichyl-phosphooligosaccharide-protein glycotransferase